MKPGETYTGDVDGISHPKRPGEIFKTVDGVDAVATANGVTPKPRNSTASIAQGIRGGWKDEEFMADLSEKKVPDHGWDELFNKTIPRLPSSPVPEGPFCPYHQWLGR